MVNGEVHVGALDQVTSSRQIAVAAGIGRDVAAAAAQSCKPSISVVGLGYVGAVSMACLSHIGFRMVGVDVSLEKVRSIKSGQAPIVEAQLGRPINEVFAEFPDAPIASASIAQVYRARLAKGSE